MAKKPMSSEHKQALAEGRAQGRAVRAYLEALEANKPKRGRKRTPESIQKKLIEIDEEMVTANALTRVKLVQQQIDLSEELESMTSSDDVDIEGLEADFVAASPGYSERKGISYKAWREVGVPAAVLKKAGISRAS